MTYTWADLAALREHGTKPTMAVFVTENRWNVPTLWRLGVMVILHEAGQPMPVELLEGLRVILWFDNCGKAVSVNRLIEAKGVKVESCEAYCECERELMLASLCWSSCRSLADVKKSMGESHASA